MRKPHALVEPAIAAIAPYEPGKPLEELARELGDRWPKDGAIKLASNENPHGPSPRAIAAVQAHLAGAHRYPDGGAFYFRQRVAQHHGVEPSFIAAANGSNELIDLIIQAFCDEHEDVLAPRYSFVCYRLGSLAYRRGFREAPVGKDFGYDFERLIAAVDERTKVVFVANPNNPTGVYATGKMIQELIERLPQDIVLVFDEAYVEYARATDYQSALTWLGQRDRMIVLRTFSKVYGLAGLRIGYAVAAPHMLEPIHKVRLAFNTGALAQIAAIAALDDVEHVTRSTTTNAIELVRLSNALTALGVPVVPSQTNFVLADFSPRKGREVYGKLLERGVIVRPMTPYGLEHHLRISIGTTAENDRLLAALPHVLG